MMGGHHAASGAAAWVAIASPAAYAFGLYPATPLGVVAGSLVCAGAALLPDADHPEATIAHSLPPVSRWICEGVGKVSGGHRHGTHSILAVIAFTLLAGLAGKASFVVPPAGVIEVGPLYWQLPNIGSVAIGSGIVGMVLVSFAAKTLKLTRGKVSCWLFGIAVGAFVTLVVPTEWVWLPLAVGVGCLVHLVGDSLTVGGVPWLWPWVPKPPKVWAKTPIVSKCWQPNGYMGVPILGKAGSWREWLLLIPVSLYALVGIVESAAMGMTGIAPGWMLMVVERLVQGRPG